MCTWRLLARVGYLSLSEWIKVEGWSAAQRGSSSGCTQMAPIKSQVTLVSNKKAFHSLYNFLTAPGRNTKTFDITGGMIILAEGFSGTRAHVWYTLTLTVKVC